MSGLGNLTPYHESSCLPSEVAKQAQEVIPVFFTQGDVAPKYREHVLMEYMENDGIPPRVADNGERRTPNQTRLDRAWTEVAERMDVSPETVRNCVLGVYDGPGDYDDMPGRLRADFNTILSVIDETQE